MKSIKEKEWCIALDNIGPYIDPVLGLRYKFLKGERATKEKVFNMIPGMTEEEYARCFRSATEEEINGEFEWDGEQYVLVKEKDTSGLTELEKAAVEAFKQIVDSDKNNFLEIFKAGANWQKQQGQATIELAEDHAYFAGRTKTIDEIKEALLSDILPYFMHGGEADEVVAKLDEMLNQKK